MRRSRERILTTHAGSLPRPDDLLAMITDHAFGQPVEETALADRIAEAVREVVRRQVAVGLDVISDGEMSKPGFFAYVVDRLSGFGGESATFAPRDLIELPGSSRPRGAGSRSLASVRPGNDGPIAYVGRPRLEGDIRNLRAAAEGEPAIETFMPAVAPGTVVQNMPSTHYGSRRQYLYALADALREEYRAIVEAGIILQVDCPDLAMDRHVEFADAPLEEFRTAIHEHVEVLNHALAGLDPERIRVHVCWGNYPGPHHLDVPLRDVLDVVYGVNAAAISVEGANPRHEHEWTVFRELPLPEDRVLIPGVIDTNSPYVEHPEVVAQRLLRYAEVVGRERLIAGTDCGFGTMGGGGLSPGVVYAKLASLVEGARLASAALESHAEPPASTGPLGPTGPRSQPPRPESRRSSPSGRG